MRILDKLKNIFRFVDKYLALTPPDNNNSEPNSIQPTVDPLNRTTVVLAAISLKHSGAFALLPANLNLDAHIERYPLTNYQFTQTDNGKLRTINSNGTLGSFYDKERMIFILGLINSKPANNKSLLDEDGYIPISSKDIRYFFKDYLSYLNYLIDTCILESDNCYIAGEKCKCYRYTAQYFNSPFFIHRYSRAIEGTISPIEEEVFNKATKELERNALLDCDYLANWYRAKKIQIDADSACEYANNKKQRLIDAGSANWEQTNTWDVSLRRFRRKNPYQQYASTIHNINVILFHQYRAKIDTNVHRLHSVLTNLQKDIRSYITYEDIPLVSIDVKNSQPYLICLILNQEFWNSRSVFPVNINSLPKNIIEMFTTPSSIIAGINEYFPSITDNSLEEYKIQVSNGRLYEVIQDWVNSKPSRRNNLIDRKKVKTSLLAHFYAENKGEPARKYLTERAFETLFPSVEGLCRLIKEDYEGASIDKQYSRLACLLQSIESEIILHRCCKKIWEDGEQKVPVFTIHDSIVTTVEHQDFVRRIMLETLTNCVGIQPTLSIETWIPSNNGE